MATAAATAATAAVDVGSKARFTAADVTAAIKHVVVTPSFAANSRRLKRLVDVVCDSRWAARVSAQVCAYVRAEKQRFTAAIAPVPVSTPTHKPASVAAAAAAAAATTAAAAAGAPMSWNAKGMQATAAPVVDND
jgi:hypothetical protein